MIIFLYGPDDYRRLQKREEITAEFKKKHPSGGCASFDFLDENGMEQFKGFAASQSIFDSAKLAILENAFELDASKLAKLLKPFAEDKSITLLISEGGKPVKALAFLIEKPSLSQNFEKLEGAMWSRFVASQIKKYGVGISSEAIRFLEQVYKGNSWALVTELEKLAALGTPVGKKELEEFGLVLPPDYWSLVLGLKSRDMKNRITALEALLALSEHPAKVFNILAAQAGEKTPLMAEFDLAVKSGKLDYDEALLDFAIS